MRLSRAQCQAFYHSREWIRLRRRYIQLHPACVRCRRIVERMAVDHILPLQTHWHSRLDTANLQTLCPGCHRHKYREDVQGYRTDVDATGWPRDKRHPIHGMS